MKSINNQMTFADFSSQAMDFLQEQFNNAPSRKAAFIINDLMEELREADGKLQNETK